LTAKTPRTPRKTRDKTLFLVFLCELCAFAVKIGVCPFEILGEWNAPTSCSQKSCTSYFCTAPKERLATGGKSLGLEKYFT
jgi:hypothetical protein